QLCTPEKMEPPVPRAIVAAESHIVAHSKLCASATKKGVAIFSVNLRQPLHRVPPDRASFSSGAQFAAYLDRPKGKLKMAGRRCLDNPEQFFVPKGGRLVCGGSPGYEEETTHTFFL